MIFEQYRDYNNDIIIFAVTLHRSSYAKIIRTQEIKGILQSTYS